MQTEEALGAAREDLRRFTEPVPAGESTDADAVDATAHAEDELLNME